MTRYAIFNVPKEELMASALEDFKKAAGLGDEAGLEDIIQAVKTTVGCVENFKRKMRDEPYHGLPGA